MKVLLDTCVLTELQRVQGHSGIKAAVAELAEVDIFVSVLTIGEIAKGIKLLDPGRKKRTLTSWHIGLSAQFGDRILKVDADTAQLWGDLSARAQKTGFVIPAIDGLLAATAIQHSLYVMTRNTRHFQASGALVLDPWRD